MTAVTKLRAWRYLAATCLSLTVCLSGCGKSPPPMNDNVQGTVKVNGTPLVGVLVQFVPQGESGLLSGSAITDAQGHYEVQTGEHPGAILGKHSVIIVAGRGQHFAGQRPSGCSAARRQQPAPAAPKGNPRIPPGFSDLQKPQLTVEVTADKHTDYDLELGKKR